MTIHHSSTGSDGFCRVDLAGSVLGISLLGLLVIGSGSATRSSAESVACLGNHRQLIRAWSEHAQDNRFLLRHYVGLPTVPVWGDRLDWWTDRAITNVTTVLTPEFRPYIGTDAGVFRCPSDRFVSEAQIRRGWRHRVRTVSMNSHVGADRTDWGGAFPTYLRFDDFTDPSGTFVFAEEHPGGINDASFAADPTGARSPETAWLVDIPASFHDRGGHFGFSDGHAELHRWVGARVVQPVVGGESIALRVRAPNDRDAIWLGLHAAQMR
jgi:hypothetical protein